MKPLVNGHFEFTVTICLIKIMQDAAIVNVTHVHANDTYFVFEPHRESFTGSRLPIS